MVEVSNNFIQECEANVGTYKFGKIKVNYIDDNPLNYEQGAYSSSNGVRIDSEQSIRYNKLVECEPNFKYKIELGNSAYKMKIVTYTEAQAFIAAHDNLIDGSELTTEATAKYISVTIYSNDTLEGTNITLNNTIRNGEILGAELEGNTTQNGTPTPSSPVPVNNVTGLQTITISGTNSKNYEINLGKNLYEGSQDFSGNWDNADKWTTANETYNGLVVKYRQGTWNGLVKEIEIEKGGTYTFSFYAKKDVNGTINAYTGGGVGAVPDNATFNATTEWQRFSFTFTSSTGGKVRARVENPTNNTTIYICGYQLEKNNTMTSYAPYFTPIELNKIGNYQDYIKKGTGKNLYIGYDNMLEGFLPTNGAYPVTNSSFPNAKYMLIDLKKGEKITTSGISTNTNGRARCIDAVTNQVVRPVGLEQNSYFEVTIGYGDGFRNGTITAKKDIIIGFMLLNDDLVGLDYFQIERGNSATYFEPYACTGKNLFDKNTQLYESNRYIDGSGQVGTNTEWSIFKTNLKPNTTYTLTNSGASSTPGYVLYNSSGVRVGGSNYLQRSHITFTTTSDTSYMLESVVANTASNRYDLNIFQIEQGSTATSYEPFVYSTLKDKWYIEKNTLKIIVPNAVTGTMQNSNKRFYVNGRELGTGNILRNTSSSQTYGLYCDILEEKTAGQTWAGTQGISYDYNSGQNIGCIDFAISGLTTIAEYQNALKGKAIYAIANTPTYTLIENEELIEQLNAVSHAETQEGTTNITSSGILPAILEVTPNLIESIRGKQTTPIVGYTITGEDDLINFKITSKADSNGNILGATSQSQVDIEIFNENNTHNLENKQVYISTGLNETEGNYCKWQPFTITQTKDTQTKNHTTYTGYDDMMRGNEAYVDNIDYGEGITLYDFTCNLAKEMGMALENTTMTNGEFIVKGNNFTNNETKLVVLKNVAQMVGGFATIDRDNLLRIIELSPEDAMTPIELTTNLYTENFQNSAKFGEINEIAIGETNLETNAIVRSDEAAIAKDGVKKIEILDNLFLGMLEDKELAIDPLWDAFEGFNYYPFKTPYNGYPYLDLGDKVNITDINSNVYGTLVLNNVFEYNGGYKGNIGAEALSITAAKYKTNNTLSKQFRKVGIDIDRVEGEITAEVEARKGTDAEVSRISQTSSEINERLEATETTLYDSEDGLVNKVTNHFLDIQKTADGLEIEVGRVDVLKDDVKALDDNTLDIRENFLFNEDGLTIRNKGSDTQDMKLNLTNEAIKFLHQNHAVLTINGSMIEFSSASFKKLDLGNYVWQAEDDDSLSLIYES